MPRLVVALGGGGARGLAHVGALQVLEEEGIVIRGIAGTSIGAIVGGLFAALGEARYDGKHLAHLLATAPRSPFPNRHGRRSFQDWFDTIAYLRGDIFGLGRDDGKALEEAIRAWAGPRRIETLPVPFAAVATDVRTGEAVVLARGPLAPALHASSALPGVYAPVQIEGRLLIDGGVVENLPVRTARRLGGDVVLALSVASALEPVVPTTGLGVLGRAELIRAAREEALAMADADIAVSLRPPRDAGVFDFDRAAEIMRCGREAMTVALPRVRDALAAPTG